VDARGVGVNTRYVETTVRGRYLLDPGPVDAGTLLVGFHGYGETAEAQMERLQRFPGTDRSVLVSVQSLHLFYTKAGDVVGSWMTKLGRELAIPDNVAYVAAVVAEVKRSHPAARRLIYLGFSQGASMAYRAAAHAGHPCAGVFVLGGDMPPDVADDPDAVLPPVLAARGVRDDWFTEAKLQRDVERLRARGASVRSVVFEGGHEWPDPLFGAASEYMGALEVA
jgi:predicted esterase